MKKINIILSISIVLICFTSCSKFSKEEILISDYVQTSNGVKTDMKFKILEINEENLISNRDSLVILLRNNKHGFGDMNKVRIRELLTNSDFTYSKGEIDIIINNIKVDEDVISFFAFIKENRHKLDSLENVASNYTDEIRNLPYESLNREVNMRLKIYDAISDTREILFEANAELRIYTETIEYIERLNQKEYEILLVPFYVKYEIHNPLLNSVKQEITKVFYFNGKRDRIIDITNVKKINKLEIPNSIHITSPWLKDLF